MALKRTSPSDLADKFLLRLPDGLRTRISIEAALNNRSMNSEIVSLLEREYPEAPSAEDLLQSIDHMIEMYKNHGEGIVAHSIKMGLNALQVRLAEMAEKHRDHISN